jgi:hypothetical protein
MNIRNILAEESRICSKKQLELLLRRLPQIKIRGGPCPELKLEAHMGLGGIIFLMSSEGTVEDMSLSPSVLKSIRVLVHDDRSLYFKYDGQKYEFFYD